MTALAPVQRSMRRATAVHHSSGYRRRRRRATFLGLAFVSPWLIGLLAFGVYPFVTSLFYSFTAYSTLEPPRWVGLANYAQLAGDERFATAVSNSIFYAVLAVTLETVAALSLAMLLNQRIRLRAFFRTAFFLPSVTPVVATAIIWLWMFNPRSGVVNSVLEAVGIDGPGWLADPSWSKPALVIMSLWRIGTAMLIYLAALQDVPRDLLEAAEIDGAGALRRMWHVVLPMVSPVMLFVGITSLINALQLFTEVQVMTGGTGAPADSTLMVAVYLWQTAFQNFNMGYASAQAWVLLLLIMALTVITFRLSRRRIHYGD
ncbi:multiple sugar transport system permease protein [Friedmanniella endophytica]|uniref:Multiple sugar transport system permease protein n=1 Tax=Microlunatus kandeliicorticis TaxID=1759536 RepID=A0A7W3IT67_9ACTN|nr:sugar ABC transporter permease [Microlunatus kandeliicorticis]MBA8794763.1 multiple sugar transport system permease protein [Microlunatus kandeliicorticis]